MTHRAEIIITRFTHALLQEHVRDRLGQIPGLHPDLQLAIANEYQVVLSLVDGVAEAIAALRCTLAGHGVSESAQLRAVLTAQVLRIAVERGEVPERFRSVTVPYSTLGIHLDQWVARAE